MCRCEVSHRPVGRVTPSSACDPGQTPCWGRRPVTVRRTGTLPGRKPGLDPFGMKEAGLDRRNGKPSGAAFPLLHVRRLAHLGISSLAFYMSRSNAHPNVVPSPGYNQVKQVGAVSSTVDVFQLIRKHLYFCTKAACMGIKQASGSHSTGVWSTQCEPFETPLYRSHLLTSAAL